LGGGDFLARLLPKTHAWAGLQVAREAARETDRLARRKYANPDAMRSLFFLGAELDNQLAERIYDLKSTHCDQRNSPAPLPEHVLPGLSVWTQRAFARGALQEFVTNRLEFDVVPCGRRLKGNWPQSAVVGVKHLASALFTQPLQSTYPLAFYEVVP
jgi:hypothetical protein